jgi:hypothetical protein
MLAESTFPVFPLESRALVSDCDLLESILYLDSYLFSTDASRRAFCCLCPGFRQFIEKTCTHPNRRQTAFHGWVRMFLDRSHTRMSQ